MSRTSLAARQRQEQLAERLALGQRIRVAAAAREFGVVPMTIRRDLAALAESGRALRYHGGAVGSRRVHFEFEFAERQRLNREAKRRIGAAAAARVSAGQTVLLDTGSTAYEVARSLVGSRVRCTVITSSLVQAAALWGHACVQVMLTGGRVRGNSPDLVGPAAVGMLETITADIAFLGSDGIDPDRGCFAMDIEASAVVRSMAASTRKVIVVADSSKLGQAGGAHVLDIADMSELISDRRADPAAVETLRRQGAVVTLV